MKTKINGWQRLGVIISIIWLIASVCIVFVDFGKFMHTEIVNTSKDGLKELISEYDDKNKNSINSYQVDVIEDGILADLLKIKDERQGKDYIHARITTIYNTHIVYFIFAPIILFWVISYSSYYAFRWIKDGFNCPNKPPS